MPPIQKIKVVDPESVERDVCVVNGQAFYQSTGTSTDLRFHNIWMPFKGFGETIPGVTGMFHKPDVASYTNAKTKTYFPNRKIAKALEDNVGRQPLEWGRFQDTDSLVTTCQLSRARMETEFPAVLSSVERAHPTMGDAIIPNYASDSEAPHVLNAGTIHDLNDTLRSMGANLSEDMSRDYDPEAEIANAVHNPLHSESSSDASSETSSEGSNETRSRADSEPDQDAPRKQSCCAWLSSLCCTPHDPGQNATDNNSAPRQEADSTADKTSDNVSKLQK
ncbi:MAG: hypothetical protein NXI01_08750 [Gammaproteobacteria bacterium]|nr:hypothetical protein [Gammaproteobacteria bacterium]